MSENGNSTIKNTNTKSKHFEILVFNSWKCGTRDLKELFISSLGFIIYYLPLSYHLSLSAIYSLKTFGHLVIY